MALSRLSRTRRSRTTPGEAPRPAPAAEPTYRLTVAHQQIVDTFAAGDLHALVVDLELFVGLEIVPDQHPLLAADQRGPHLHRREPVHIDMRDHIVGK